MVLQQLKHLHLNVFTFPLLKLTHFLQDAALESPDINLKIKCSVFASDPNL